MSRVLFRSFSLCVLLVACGVVANGQPPPAADPYVKYTKGPVGVGNPPKAGFLTVDIEWANCTGATKMVTSIWEVPPGAAPLITAGLNNAKADGKIANFDLGPMKSNIKVQFVTEIRDANDVVIARVESGVVTVP